MFAALPAVPAAVFLRDVVLNVPPDVDRREDEGNQHGEAAQEGEVGDALLLALGDSFKNRRQYPKHADHRHRQ